VTGGAGRRLSIVFPQDPFAPGQIELHETFVFPESDTMLGFSIDLCLGMVWTHVAFATVFGAACYLRGELVPRMTRRAGTPRPVSIDSPYPGVGPGVRRVNWGMTIYRYLFNSDLTAVALLTATDSRGWTFGKSSQEIVERTDKLAGNGMARVEKLFRLFFVAAGTGTGRNIGNYLHTLVAPDIGSFNQFPILHG